jgi:hypothetical protein
VEALADTEAALTKIKAQLSDIPLEIRRAEAGFDFGKRDYERKSALNGIVAGRAIDEARCSLVEATALLEGHHARENSLLKEREALVAYRDALKTGLYSQLQKSKCKVRPKQSSRQHRSALTGQRRVSLKRDCGWSG